MINNLIKQFIKLNYINESHRETSSDMLFRRHVFILLTLAGLSMACTKVFQEHYGEKQRTTYDK